MVCDGSVGSLAQKASDIHVLTENERESLLRESGVLALPGESGSALAIKADLNLPWEGMRKLQRWFKKFGVPLESEATMRRQLDEDQNVQNVPRLFEEQILSVHVTLPRANPSRRRRRRHFPKSPRQRAVALNRHHLS